MRAFVQPTGTYSHAMVRIANALERHAPVGVEITRDKSSADVIVMYAIDDVYDETLSIMTRGQRYAIVQCCLRTCAGRPDPEAWRDIWASAAAVWSYYLLPLGVDYIHAPLGVDDAFKNAPRTMMRRRLVTTSGYVSAPNAEAIDEVWEAARRLGIGVLHTGATSVEGMNTPKTWRSTGWLSDEGLAEVYSQASWVAALRHVEGFELPAAEGLSCGALPIVFDQPATRHWYGGHALLIPECHGEELVGHLVEAMSVDPRDFTLGPTRWEPFGWEDACSKFWSKVTSRQEVSV